MFSTLKKEWLSTLFGDFELLVRGTGCPHNMGCCGGIVTVEGVEHKNLLCDVVAVHTCSNGHRWLTPIVEEVC